MTEQTFTAHEGQPDDLHTNHDEIVHDIKMTGFGFEALGLRNKVLKTLGQLGFDTPTPIQRDAIPLALEGHDIMGLAQTGTGKTAAFGLPLIERLLEDGSKPEKKAARSLILAPTRELANQIAENLRAFTKHLPLHVLTVVGGQSLNTQIRNMHRGTDILVATPGRLIDLMKRNAISLHTARFLVLDEADQMLDLGFIHSLRQIAKSLPRERQTMLFSATMPKQIEDLAATYLKEPVRVQVSPPGKAADKIRQSVHYVHQRAKADKLKDLLVHHMDDRALVFARTKHGAEKLMKHLVDCGFSASSIHGNKSQGQRDRAIRAFKAGEIKVLVATDVAARGIDIPDVKHVYNYDLPEVAENYVHRIGRTARAGAEGQAIAFCGPHENKLLREIEKLMKITIHVESGEKQPDEKGEARNQRGGNRAARGPVSNGGKRNGGNSRGGDQRKGSFEKGPSREGNGRKGNVRNPVALSEFGNDKPAARHDSKPARKYQPDLNRGDASTEPAGETGFKDRKKPGRNARPGRRDTQAGQHANADNASTRSGGEANGQKRDGGRHEGKPNFRKNAHGGNRDGSARRDTEGTDRPQSRTQNRTSGKNASRTDEKSGAKPGSRYNGKPAGKAFSKGGKNGGPNGGKGANAHRGRPGHKTGQRSNGKTGNKPAMV